MNVYALKIAENRAATRKRPDGQKGAILEYIA